jgi:site-specific recombinase XerD
MNNTELLDEFCDTLWLEDGLSRNTLDSYRRDLNRLSGLSIRHFKSQVQQHQPQYLQPQALVSLPAQTRQNQR